MLNHELYVGVKCTSKRGRFANQCHAIARSASETLDAADQQQPEVAPGRQSRSLARVESLASFIDVLVKVMLVENLISAGSREW